MAFYGSLVGFYSCKDMNNFPIIEILSIFFVFSL